MTRPGGQTVEVQRIYQPMNWGLLPEQRERTHKSIDNIEMWTPGKNGEVSRRAPAVTAVHYRASTALSGRLGGVGSWNPESDDFNHECPSCTREVSKHWIAVDARRGCCQ